jgi:hypothetical protein
MEKTTLKFDNISAFFGQSAMDEFIDEFERATGMDFYLPHFVEWFELVHADLNALRRTLPTGSRW